MARTLRIEWRPGLKVTARIEVVRDPAGPAFLIAPGAGAGQDHPFLVGVRHRLARRGHSAMTFDYPYREAGRRAPDRSEVLMACHRAAAERLRTYQRSIVLAGKSMGGRMASHLAAAGYPASGLVVFGYPLVPVGKTAPRGTAHLDDVTMPMLFLQGDRDRLAPLADMRAVVDRLPWADLAVIPGADHSFAVPQRSGRDPGEVLDLMVEAVLDWRAHRR